MSGKKKYWIKGGSSYTYRDEIKAQGGRFDPVLSRWSMMATGRNDKAYIALKGLGFELVPVLLTKECQKIQDILGKQ